MCGQRWIGQGQTGANEHDPDALELARRRWHNPAAAGSPSIPAIDTAAPGSRMFTKTLEKHGVGHAASPLIRRLRATRSGR
jgi:hypothetical protein